MLLIFNASYSQNSEIKRTNHWYFGQNAGLDFSTGIVVPDTNGAYDNYEAAATISDTAGNLLFYTDAETVWNSNHQIMQNGTNIGGCWSSTQGALIVPKPGNDSIYYIFTTDCGENNLVNGLRYAVVNINLGSGSGAVIQKNILLRTPVAEKIAGIHHVNGADIWVVTHEWNSDKFLAYLVTSNGVDTVPVVSSVGSLHTGLTLYENSSGYMKFSSNAKKITVVQSGSSIVELFDFNDSTALISNVLVLSNGDNMRAYGASFSSDNSKLYISYPYNSDATIAGKLFQFNLLAGSLSAIITSKTLIYSSTNYNFYALQNGKDGKIYLAETYFQTNDGGILGIINNPNELGVSCNFVQFGINLSGKLAHLGLPNFIENYFYCDTCKNTTGISENIFIQHNITIYPNPANNIINIHSVSEPIEKIIIYNLLGEIVYSSLNIYSVFEFNIPSDNFTEGIYLIHIQRLSENTIRKLIIIH